MKNIETFFKLVRNLFFSTFALIFMLMSSASANINALVIDENNLNKTKVFTITSESIKTLSPEDSVKVFKPLLCDINRAKSSPSIFLKKLDCYVSERNFPLLRNVILELNPEQIRAILPDIVDSKDKSDKKKTIGEIAFPNDSTKFNKNIPSWNVSFIGDSNLANLFINYSTEMKRKKLMKDFFNSNDVIFYKNKDDKILFRLNSYASSLVKFLKILKDNKEMPITVEDHLDLLDAFAKNYMENVRNRDEGIEDNTGLNVVIKNVLSNPKEGLNIFSLNYKIVETHLNYINQIGWKHFYVARCVDTHHVNTTQTKLSSIVINTEITPLLYDNQNLLTPRMRATLQGIINNHGAVNPEHEPETGGGKTGIYSVYTLGTSIPMPRMSDFNLTDLSFKINSSNQPSQYSLCIGAGYDSASCGTDPSALK